MRKQKQTSKVKPSFKLAWKNLISYVRPYIIPIIIAIIFTIASTILMILGPKKLETFAIELNLSLFGKPIDMDLVSTILITLIIYYVLAAIFNYVQSLILAKTTQLTSVRLRNDLSIKINNLPLKYFDKTTHGDVMSRITNDVDTINMTLNNSISQLMSALTMFIGASILMFTTNWIMALTTILASFIGFLVMGFIMSKSQKYFKGQQKALGLVNGHIEEIYTGHRVVKISNAENTVTKEFDSLNNQLRNNVWKSQFFSGLMQPLMMFISNFAYVATAIVGLILLITNRLEQPVVIATFIFYVRFFTQTLTQFAQVGTNIQQATAASERVFNFLSEEELPNEDHITESLTSIKGNVRFENVKFGYDEGKLVINNFTASVNSGSMVAIVGPTGAGKTTIVNLLMNFYELDEGEIYIDDIPLSNLSRANIHNIFGMVLQDTWIFEGSIKDNIIYNQENVSEEELVRAAKAVGLDHFIRTLPNGYNAILDDKLSLSEGQKQLLTIARAMIKDAPMLILDEATSSVDTRTEKLIQNAMEKLTIGRTSFVIAHRLSTIVNADLILVMNHGDIIEQGNHKELLELNGFYAKLYQSQFEE